MVLTQGEGCVLTMGRIKAPQLITVIIWDGILCKSKASRALREFAKRFGFVIVDYIMVNKFGSYVEWK